MTKSPFTSHWLARWLSTAIYPEMFFSVHFPVFVWLASLDHPAVLAGLRAIEAVSVLWQIGSCTMPLG